MQKGEDHYEIFRWVGGYWYQLTVYNIFTNTNRDYSDSLVFKCLTYSTIFTQGGGYENHYHDCDVLSAGRDDGSVDGFHSQRKVCGWLVEVGN